MSIYASRTAVLGALLAFVALLGMSVLSGWHSAHVHQGDPAHDVFVADTHHDLGRVDTDRAAHLAAHTVGHGFAVPQPASLRLPAPIDVKNWTAARELVLTNLHPAALLRPPRA